MTMLTSMHTPINRLPMDYTDESEIETFKVGSTVPTDGFYICVPCGSKKYLKTGERFSSCLTCMGKEKRFFRRGLELWERITGSK